MKNIIFGFCILMLPVLVSGQHIIVEIDGDINLNGSSLLISEAGEDFNAIIENSSPVYMAILYHDLLGRNLNQNQRWHVSVHKQNMNWNENLNLQIRRTGDGIKYGGGGSTQIQNGQNYRQITNSPNYFFQGRGQIIQIPLAFNVNGVSVTMGACDLETSLIFTVYDNW
jgi:hypothetical protein